MTPSPGNSYAVWLSRRSTCFTPRFGLGRFGVKRLIRGHRTILGKNGSDRGLFRLKKDLSSWSPLKGGGNNERGFHWANNDSYL